jgi:hypothetical protein
MALGRARLVQPSQPDVDERRCRRPKWSEVLRLTARHGGARRTAAARKVTARWREGGEFIDAHSLILDDPN